MRCKRLRDICANETVRFHVDGGPSAILVLLWFVEGQNGTKRYPARRHAARVSSRKTGTRKVHAVVDVHYSISAITFFRRRLLGLPFWNMCHHAKAWSQQEGCYKYVVFLAHHCVELAKAVPTDCRSFKSVGWSRRNSRSRAIYRDEAARRHLRGTVACCKERAFLFAFRC